MSLQMAIPFYLEKTKVGSVTIGNHDQLKNK